MTEFLSAEKIKSKKVLALLQKDKKKYLKSLETGSWLPTKESGDTIRKDPFLILVMVGYVLTT